MRIAISSKNFAGHTGSSRIIAELAKGFIARGDQVDIIGNTLNKGAIRAVGAKPVEIKKFLLGKKLSREAYMGKHARYMDANSYGLRIGNGDEARQDILLLHNCVNLSHELAKGVPYTGDSALRGVSAIHRKILKERLFKKMVVNSNLVKKDISTRYAVDESLIEVIRPAYDHAVFTPAGRDAARADFRRQAGIPEGAKFLVGLVCSGDFTKRNLKGFLAAVTLLPANLADKIHMVVVGKDKIGDFVDAPPKNLTHIPLSDEPARIMRALDVMLYPALLEEFGLVVAETLACGTPVFSSRMVGAAECFTGLHAEALCDKPDARHFAAELARFLSDGDYREKLTGEASGMMASLTWQNYFREFIKVADEVLAEKS